jgi:hypothetical protein
MSPAPVSRSAPPGHGSTDAREFATPAVWRSQWGLVRALWVLFVAAMAVALFTVVVLAHRISVAADLQESGERWRSALADDASRADDLVTVAFVLFAIVSVAIGIVLMIWLWRAAKNNEALGRDHPRLAPGWAIGGWFIPCANFVIPVLMVQDLWRGSNVAIARGEERWRIADRSALVGWWWGAWLFTFLRVGTGASAGSPNVDLSELRASDALGIVGMVAAVVAAVLGILVVRAVTSRQDVCLRAQQAAWAEASGAG